jgi:putative transposase
MPHTYIDHVMHFVFSTKDRRPFLTSERQQLIWPYMGGIAKQNRMKPIIIGGVEDHVHMLLAMPSDMDPATAMQHVKGGSSKWVRENHLPDFQWQQGFAGFGVIHSGWRPEMATQRSVTDRATAAHRPTGYRRGCNHPRTRLWLRSLPRRVSAGTGCRSS